MTGFKSAIKRINNKTLKENGIVVKRRHYPIYNIGVINHAQNWA